MSKILYSSEHGDLRGKKNKQESATDALKKPVTVRARNSV